MFGEQVRNVRGWDSESRIRTAAALDGQADDLAMLIEYW